MRNSILLVSFLGVMIFAAAFVLSLLNPILVERGAREIVRIEVERQVGQRIDVLSNSRVTEFAQKVLRRTSADLQNNWRSIRDELPRQVAYVVANMLNVNCECRKRLAEGLQKVASNHLSLLAEARQGLSVLIESAYASVAANLLREFRIFTASNAAVFAILGLLALVRTRATLQLALLALVLLGTVAIATTVYVFCQNWLHTIVFGQYVGLAYTVYLAAPVFIMSDIAFNRARVTTQLVNCALSVVGSVPAATPC